FSQVLVLCFFVFFFQAEDGIRDFHVTGVQTCALPIWSSFGVELYCSAPVTQWWLVMINPSGDTNEAEQPPRYTTEPKGSPMGEVSCFGSSFTPSLLNASTCCGALSWPGSHMPPGLVKAGGDGVASGSSRVGSGGVGCEGGASAGCGVQALSQAMVGMTAALKAA